MLCPELTGEIEISNHFTGLFKKIESQPARKVKLDLKRQPSAAHNLVRLEPPNCRERLSVSRSQAMMLPGMMSYVKEGDESP